jgi:uncharacterized protein YneF (UPF0154 family)
MKILIKLSIMTVLLIVLFVAIPLWINVILFFLLGIRLAMKELNEAPTLDLKEDEL